MIQCSIVSFPGDRALDPETNRQEFVALCMRGILLRDFIASFFVKDDRGLKMALKSFSSVLHVPQVSAVLDVAFIYQCFSLFFFSSLFPNVSNFGRGVGEGDIEDGGRNALCLVSSVFLLEASTGHTGARRFCPQRLLNTCQVFLWIEALSHLSKPTDAPQEEEERWDAHVRHSVAQLPW